MGIFQCINRDLEVLSHGYWLSESVQFSRKDFTRKRRQEKKLSVNHEFLDSEPIAYMLRGPAINIGSENSLLTECFFVTPLFTEIVS